VFVNGVEFSTTGTTIRLDDRTVTQDELRVGMVVRVDGSIDDRRATTLSVDDALKGRLEQIVDANRLVVMGQTVQVDERTQYEDGVQPAVGDWVEVHGLIAGDGVVAGGYVERRDTPATPPFAVRGTVHDHDAAAQRFRIGTLVVQATGADIGDMPAGSWNGLQVDVKGSTCAGAPVCGTLAATQVEPAGASVTTAPKARVAGFISSLAADGFQLGNQRVVVSATTRYEGGTVDDLLAGAAVEAEGAIAAGVLTAAKVSFRDAIRLEADVASVDAGAGTLTLAGMPGVTVRVDGLTAFKDVASLAALAAPNHLRLRGRLGTGNTLIANELELRDEDSDTRVIVQAVVQSASPESQLTLLGQVVDTSTVSSYLDVHDAPITRSAFYAAATAGALVKARGTLGTGGSVRWDEMQLEQEDD
jgi:hypothetical protein